jgi:hypothetical protein
MTDNKTPLQPSRRPEDIRGTTQRAREFAERLRAKYPNREFQNSARIVCEDRDTYR